MAQLFEGCVKVIVPCGSLGAGVREEEITYGLAAGAQVIATDAGSTDSGAAYLALGKSKNNRGAVKRDLTILMKAQARSGVPIIVGTAGQAGGDLNLDWTRDIALEIAKELGVSPKIALIYCEQDKDTIKKLNAEGRIKALPPHAELEDATVDSCEHIVAALGWSPLSRPWTVVPISYWPAARPIPPSLAVTPSGKAHRGARPGTLARPVNAACNAPSIPRLDRASC